MILRVNGEEKTFYEKIDNVKQLLDVLGVKPHLAAVEVNRTIVDPKLFEQTMLKDRDRVEIVSFVGGG
jgi:thiamine biosynthesis protein ThiS